MKNKQPFFGEHLSIDQSLCFTNETINAIGKVIVQMRDKIDDLIVEEIKNAALREGATDVYILSKPEIISALRKQIPQKPEYCDGDYDYAKCPACGNDDYEWDINNWRDPYCPQCGQALDWSDVE